MLELGAEGTEPAEPFLVGNRRIGGRRRREHEESGVPKPPSLQPVLGPLTEDALVRRLADERDDLRPKLLRQSLEPLRRAGEVAAAQVAAALGRAVGGVREPEAEVEHLPLLLGYEEPGRQVRLGEESPEIVARVGEVGRGRSGAKTGVDPAE